MQGRVPTIWALVTDSQSPVLRCFHVVGTGHPADHVRENVFVGTVQESHGLVFHFFDAGEFDIPTTYSPTDPKSWHLRKDV
jgi:hypothetical protein